MEAAAELVEVAVELERAPAEAAAAPVASHPAVAMLIHQALCGVAEPRR